MPNWCYNEITINEKDKHKILKASFEDGKLEYAVDFNIISPMPQELEVVSGSSNDVDMYIFMSERGKFTAEETAKRFATLGLDKDKIITNAFSDNWYLEISKRAMYQLSKNSEDCVNEQYDCGKQLIENYINYGVPSWYEWRYKNWGCKWNASSSQILVDECDEDNIVIYFETPWGPPVEWCAALAKAGIDFNLRWTTEDGYSGEIYNDCGELAESLCEDEIYDADGNLF